MTLIDYDRVADEAWSCLTLACDDPSRPMRNVVLATAGERRAPDARLMVLRGADRKRGQLWFHTDVRSPKVEQIRARPDVVVVMWDPVDRVQLRITGTAAILAGGAFTDQHWSQASMGLQVLLASPDDPGRPLTQPDPRLVGMKRALDAGEEVTARSRFAVIEVTVDSIDWYQVTDVEQRRAILQAANGWVVQPLAP